MADPEYRDYQQAAAHGSRRFNAVAVYERQKGVTDRALRVAVGRLLSAVEAIPLDTLNVLVGIGWTGLTGHPAYHELVDAHPTIPHLLDPMKAAPKLRKATPGDVLVQIAAETENDRLFALRLAQALLAPEAVLLEETLGVRHGVGREAFGYRNAQRSSQDYERDHLLELALIANGKGAGGGWLLFQRFVQEVTRFHDLNDVQRDEVIGISPDGDLPRGGPSRSGHVTLARAYRKANKGAFVRRGFAYRGERGEEGLCFLALSAAPESFTEAHQAMASGAGGPDALLPFIEARAGGLYFAPPSAEWIAPGVQPVELPPSAKELARTAPLILAEMTPAALAYAMKARGLGAFRGSLGHEEIVAELKPIVDVVNVLVARQNAANPPTSYDELTALLAKALEQANAVNHEAGEYITLDP